MKIITHTLFFFIFCTCFFAGCKHKETPTEIKVEKFNHDSILANDPVLKKADSMALVFDEIDKVNLEKVTSIKFDKEVYDFGKCNEGDKISKIIEFTNAGKLPLVITQAYGSCGCTIPKYDKEPVAPGKKGKIEIQFDSSHKTGANTKSVMIQANTNPPITTVSFSIKVNENSKKKGWFN